MEKNNLEGADMKQSGKVFYILYIIIGILYVAAKIIFVSAGYLHPGAILHGLIPAVITTFTGVFVLREKRMYGQGRIWHTLALIFPLLILVTTPLYMYLKERGMWLESGRLAILIIYEVMAVVQFLMIRKAKTLSS